MQADMEMIIISGLDFSNTATTIGIRIPKVPQEVWDFVNLDNSAFCRCVEFGNLY